MPTDKDSLATRLEKHVDTFLLTAVVFALAGATAFVMAVTMGDWEYWVDWKDRRFWPLVPIVLLIIFPAGLSAAFWTKFRLPIACTAVVLCYSLIRWASAYLNFHLFAGFPMSFVWPSVFIPMAIILDCSLLITRSVFLTGVSGAFMWGILIYPVNWPMLAAFHEPINYQGEMLTARRFIRLRVHPHRFAGVCARRRAFRVTHLWRRRHTLNRSFRGLSLYDRIFRLLAHRQHTQPTHVVEEGLSSSPKRTRQAR